MLWCMCKVYVWIILLIAKTTQSTLIDKFGDFSNLPLRFLPEGNVSIECQRQTEAVKEGVQDIQLWALKILDASAKIPSGILSGNNNQFGDFDLCLSARSETGEGQVRGRYCLIDFDIKLNDDYKDLDDRTHGLRSMTSEISDPGYRLPKLGSWRWGVCVPTACQASDIQQHIETVLADNLKNIATVEVKADSDMCYEEKPTALGLGHYLTLSICTVIIVSLVLGTIWDNSRTSSELTNTQRILTCFSVRRNWTDFTKTTNGSSDIEIIHGARALNAMGLLLSHKQMAQLFNPHANSLKMSQAISGVWSMIGRTASLYTDSFIFISGLLASYAMINELDRNQKLDVKKSFISRYIRFTPNLLVVILTSTFLTDFLGPGPLWGLVVLKYSNFCKSNMWRNLLYIHNYFGLEDMCLTHTHQLGIDMQLYVMSTILVYFLWKNPKRGMYLIAAIALISTWLRYTVAIERELSPVIYYGVQVSQLFRTARYSYILPTHRLTVYCMGLMVGYGARRGIGSIQISQMYVRLGWSAAVGMALLAMFGASHMATPGYVYNATEAATFNAFAPILWCSFLAWCAVAGWNNCGGWFYEMLTWKYFLIFSRISYAFYLVQFPIFFYNVGVQRSSLYYNGFSSIIDLKEFAWVIGLSVALTLFVDMPIQNIRQLFLNKRPSDKKIINNNNEDEKKSKM